MAVSFTQGGSKYYITSDHLGSPRTISDDSGNVLKAIEYDSFGNVISDTNPALEIPFGFAGGLHDKDTNLIRFGYRDFDPKTGRWTARDPIGFAGGDTNLYGYVASDPVNFVDPNGLELQYGNQFNGLVNKVSQSKTGAKLVNTLKNSKQTYTIKAPLYGDAANYQPNSSGYGGEITLSTDNSKWVNTKEGGFALVFADRILVHELGHAYNHDQKEGPMYDNDLPYSERILQEEVYVIDKFGNAYGDGIQREGHKAACPN